jgi:hypothetical protein
MKIKMGIILNEVKREYCSRSFAVKRLNAESNAMLSDNWPAAHARTILFIARLSLSVSFIFGCFELKGKPMCSDEHNRFLLGNFA